MNKNIVEKITKAKKFHENPNGVLFVYGDKNANTGICKLSCAGKEEIMKYLNCSLRTFREYFVPVDDGYAIKTSKDNRNINVYLRYFRYYCQFFGDSDKALSFVKESALRGEMCYGERNTDLDDDSKTVMLDFYGMLSKRLSLSFFTEAYGFHRGETMFKYHKLNRFPQY